MTAELVLSLAFCGAVFWASTRRTRAGREAGFAPWAVLLFAAALLLRLVIGWRAVGFTTDMDTFKAWAYHLNRTGLREIYHQEDFFLDYPPGYLYVLLILEKLRMAWGIGFDSARYTLMLKLPSILADLACGGFLLWLGRKKRGDREGLLLAAAYLFCPVVIANSAQWGQVDSFCTAFLLASLCLLYLEWYVPSALLYGYSIACKPQMLIFAPVYIFFALRQRKPGKLALGVGCTVLAVLITATPFTEGFDYLWLLERYRSTMDYYSYYSINAYNFWTLIGFNWRALPEGAAQTLLTYAAPVLATAACGFFMLKAPRKDSMFAAPVLLMTVMYLFGVKMHERYLYPIFLFLLLCVLLTGDRSLLRSFGLSSLAHHLNVAHVLWLFREKGSNYDPNAVLTRVMALAQVAALGYGLFVLGNVYLRGRLHAPAQAPADSPAPPPNPLRRVLGSHGKSAWAQGFGGGTLRPETGPRPMARLDWLIMAGLTLVYAAVGFWQLGSHETAVTWWAPGQGESAVLEAEAPVDAVYYLPGVAPDSEGRRPRVGADFLVETSDDGLTWTAEEELLSDAGKYVFAWYDYGLSHPARYVRLTPAEGSPVLNEVGLKLQGQTVFAQVTATGEGAQALVDEQSVIPYYESYLTSSYFDEIYHARTAYEHILRLEPYENTHPPLGKLIIAAGILLFGMNPFGWRFMGALFGVLMLPVLYHLLHQLFGKPWLSALGTVWFALDFMHYTQTRIATIDTYSVFFLLLMYDAMLIFLRRDILREKLGRLLPPLLVCGVFTGLGIAAKWTAAYGAVGLALLYFGKLFLTWRDEKADGNGLAPFRRRALILCGWCCLFFIAIPAVIYFCAFLPITTLPQNRDNVFSAFIRYNVNMYNYHAGLQATHYFASPWYEWPFDVRPIWYFTTDFTDPAGHYSTISAFGNPLLWWAGVPAVLSAVVLWLRERKTWAAIVLCGFGSVYLPWVLVPRLTFIYHYFTAVPFLVVALCGLLARFAETAPGRRGLRLGPVTLTVAHGVGAAFTLGLLILFAVFFPVISGAPADKAYTTSLRWFSTWYF